MMMPLHYVSIFKPIQYINSLIFRTLCFVVSRNYVKHPLVRSKERQLVISSQEVVLYALTQHFMKALKSIDTNVKIDRKIFAMLPNEHNRIW